MCGFKPESQPQVDARFAAKVRHSEHHHDRMSRAPEDAKARRLLDARINHDIALCQYGAAAMFGGAEL